MTKRISAEQTSGKQKHQVDRKTHNSQYDPTSPNFDKESVDNSHLHESFQTLDDNG